MGGLASIADRLKNCILPVDSKFLGHLTVQQQQVYFSHFA